MASAAVCVDSSSGGARGEARVTPGIIQRTTSPAHRHPLTAGVVIFLRRVAVDVLVVVAHVVRHHAAKHRFDTVAVPASEQAPP